MHYINILNKRGELMPEATKEDILVVCGVALAFCVVMAAAAAGVCLYLAQ